MGPYYSKDTFQEDGDKPGTASKSPPRSASPRATKRGRKTTPVLDARDVLNAAGGGAPSPAASPAPPPPEEPRAAALRKLAELGAELDEIRPGSFEPRVVEELVTRLLCRIDAVDTCSDAELRGIRRDLVRRAEARSAAP
jgi:hypothetical protein